MPPAIIRETTSYGNDYFKKRQGHHYFKIDLSAEEKRSYDGLWHAITSLNLSNNVSLFAYPLSHLFMKQVLKARLRAFRHSNFWLYPYFLMIAKACLASDSLFPKSNNEWLHQQFSIAPECWWQLLYFGLKGTQSSVTAVVGFTVRPWVGLAVAGNAAYTMLTLYEPLLSPYPPVAIGTPPPSCALAKTVTSPL